MKQILVIGVTGSIGQLVVKQALTEVYQVRALVRNKQKENLGSNVELFAEKGERTQDFSTLFSSTLADQPNENFDGIKEPNNCPMVQGPK
ncbi:hypothetical protein BKK56_09460 [Rodentibacter genomosp. 2]|uniref:NmrA family NAD(P)-binding protein n=1 Tax=Rodentibacter genomosp. 2 TaxID=1908266 RepID=UPI000984213B|nr:hypothetical protein BKK56_09460 [Rodentibacter genomosp. 2]